LRGHQRRLHEIQSPRRKATRRQGKIINANTDLEGRNQKCGFSLTHTRLQPGDYELSSLLLEPFQRFLAAHHFMPTCNSVSREKPLKRLEESKLPRQFTQLKLGENDREVTLLVEIGRASCRERV